MLTHAHTHTDTHPQHTHTHTLSHTHTHTHTHTHHTHTHTHTHYLRLCPRTRHMQLLSCSTLPKRFTLRVQAQGEQLTASSKSSCSYLAQLYTLIRVLRDRLFSKGVIGQQLGRPVSTITYRVFVSLRSVFGGAPVITCT